MPPPWVTDVAFNNNQIVLTVQIDGFEDGETIELSGYATQDNGAFAVFSDLQTVPAPNSGTDTLVKVTSLSQRDFVKGHAVTVVFRAARVWTTVLEEVADGLKTGPPPEQAEDGTDWGIRTAEAYPASPSTGTTATPPQGGS